MKNIMIWIMLLLSITYTDAVSYTHLTLPTT